MSFPVAINASSANAEHKNLYTSAQFPIGQKMLYEDGRIFRFALAGELLVKGEIVMGQDSTDENDLTPVAAEIGDTTISVTIGNVTVADYFKDGYAYVNTTPALGETYKIGPHDAYAAAGGQLLNLVGNETVLVALTSTSRVSIIRNPWAGVITLATTPTGWVAGVAVSLIPSGEWGWIQTGGPCAVFAGGTDGEGIAFAASDDTAGTGLTKDADGEFTIGCVMQTGTADGDCEIIYLTID